MGLDESSLYLYALRLCSLYIISFNPFHAIYYTLSLPPPAAVYAM